ncbi:MAG: substrate-binding domain-containing protein [Paracoccaceae bacterium]
MPFWIRMNFFLPLRQAKAVPPFESSGDGSPGRRQFMTLSRTLKTTVSAAVLATIATTAFGADIFVVGGKPDDPFWSRVKKGAEDAGAVAAMQGGSVTWLGPQNYDNLGPDAAELIRQAIDQGADAIVGPDWVPEAMDPAFQAVVDAGIPLVIYNAGGIEAADRLGAMNYVGAVDYKSGYAGGEYLAAAGHTNGACVNTLPGAANIEAFCNGFNDGLAAGGGTGSVLQLPATSFGDSTAVAQAVRAHVLQNPDITAMFAIGDQDTNAAISSIEQAEGRVGACLRHELQRLDPGQHLGRHAGLRDRPTGPPAGLLRRVDPQQLSNYGVTIPTRGSSPVRA